MATADIKFCEARHCDDLKDGVCTIGACPFSFIDSEVKPAAPPPIPDKPKPVIRKK